MIYNIAVSRRVIRRIDGDEDVIQNGVVSDAIRVTFDEEWLALLGARAVFRNSSSGKVVTVEFEPAADTQIAIPWEVLANEGYLFVSFVGAPAEDSRIVTREMERPWTVAPSGCIAGPQRMRADRGRDYPAYREGEGGAQGGPGRTRQE